MLRSAPLSTASSDAAATRVARAQASSRAAWVDVAKGGGIVLVVLGHALIGMVDARLLSGNGLGARAHYLIYTFHMPLFFFLAGLFVQPRLERDASGFARGMFTRVAWPYFLWASLQSLVIAALGGLVNRAEDFGPARFVELLWEPTAQFWFLQSLFVMQLLAWLALPRWGAGRVLLLCIALRVLPEIDALHLPVAAVQMLRFAPFFMLGAWIGPWLVRRGAQARVSRACIVAAVAAIAWLAAALGVRSLGLGYWSVAALPAAFAGSIALIAASFALRGRGAAAVAALGRASMAIYVLHVLFVAGARIVLNKLFGLHEPVLILSLALVAGVAGPLAVRALALRLNAARWLGLQ